MDFCRHNLVAAVTAFCLLLGLATAADWGYFDDGATPDGPEHWIDVNSVCGDSRQSPIDITTGDAKYDDDIGRFYLSNFDTTTDLTIQIENNAHTVKLTPFGLQPRVTGGGLGEGNTYILAQLHFHWGKTENEGSEHTVDTKKFPMEMHLVTYRSDLGSLGGALGDPTGLAVLGFMVEVGTETNAGFQNIVDSLDSIQAAGSAMNMSTAFKLNELLPSFYPYFFRYPGSLTTPPCSEAVVWTVFTESVKITSQQLAKFRTILMNEDNDAGSKNMYNNYRPVMPLNGREIKTNFKVSAGVTPHVTVSLLVLPLLRLLL